jgi:hypothetical protein
MFQNPPLPSIFMHARIRIYTGFLWTGFKLPTDNARFIHALSERRRSPM